MSMEQPLNTNFGDSALSNSAEDIKPKSRFGTSTKKKIQLSWENISISAPPKGKDRATQNDKIIINDVSGTVVPGQFLAILGASGNSPYSLIIQFRCWKDYTVELFVWERIQQEFEEERNDHC